MKVVNNTAERESQWIDAAVQLDINKEWRAEAVSPASSGMTHEGISILLQSNIDEDGRVTDGKNVTF